MSDILPKSQQDDILIYLRFVPALLPAASIYTNNLLYQICVFNLHEERAVCKYLGTSNETKKIQDLEVEAQRFSANILMVTSVFTNVVPALWSFFLGPWSDKFGRKPIFISTLIGFTLQYALTAVITYMSATMLINPWWYLLTIVPLMFTGGYSSMITVLFCYITDITNDSNRSTRYFLVNHNYKSNPQVTPLVAFQDDRFRDCALHGTFTGLPV